MASFTEVLNYLNDDLVESAHYDGEEQILLVHLVDDTTAQLDGVPQSIVDEFVRARNKEEFFREELEDRFSCLIY